MLALFSQTLAYDVSTVARPTAGRSNIVMQEKSKAIPFLPAAPALDGTMAGDKGFDPLLLSNTVPLKWAREAELKHARICMLAVVGWVTVDLGFTVPYAPQVSSLAAHDAAVDKGVFLGLLIPIALVEVLAGIPKCFQIMNEPDASPGGDYKFDPLGIGASAEMQEKEISNGRLAMLAFSGIVTQAALTQGPFPYTYNGVEDLVPPMQSVQGALSIL